MRDRILLAVVNRAVAGELNGRMHITLPSGHGRTLGTSGDTAGVWFKTVSSVMACVQRGTLGFAEGVIDGDIEVSDLGAVFRFFIDNRAALNRAGRGLFQVRAADKSYHADRNNSRDGSRRNISEHYDLGNDFYALWLDPGMAYSSGIYLAPDATLDDAQACKYNAVLRALDIQPGERVLEIGCGWGGFVEAAADAGAEVRAITISQRQLAYTKNRLATRGQGDRAEAVFEDYRDTTGTFDKIASIEMIEAVGAEHWSTYFETICDRLRSGGSAVIQAITIREDSFADYMAKPDFIQRYIFPGGVLPTKTHLKDHAAAAGLSFEMVTTFGASYARTLGEWRRRFHAQWPQIEALGFDGRFRRLWDYYLTYCEAGFEKGVIDVGIYRFTRV